ncbi:HTH-type transcriptional regulator DmlR [Pseudovibrio axinellae]|uniref:HTH-type transcriptional regulator DmlR n=1 Tax=Pseudovibrio axinellae TaxID=989403 RepID=A0A165X3B9_9HYPH|nr:LysR family transcriptional regulator [Pseudovibrio axinellae]KZL17310.1 HTH-type transcriptional regulator DmlR [Pseudovibrio axinellae]SEQ19744.1 transcriptional regulator, LysR family [Pseudovibrio axinellae]
MDLLNLLESLVRVIDSGSLSAGARLRKISQPAMSQQLTLLEAHFQQELVFRTNKGIQPTPAGKLIYEHARLLLLQTTKMYSEVEELSGAERGALVISVSQPLGAEIVTPLMFELRKTYPDLAISLRIEDRFVDVVKDGVDLAIRTGDIGFTAGISRRIGTIDTCLVASPDYLAKVRVPEEPFELSAFNYIQYQDGNDVTSLELSRDGRTVMVPVQVGFIAGHPQVMMQALLNGVGYTRVPIFMVQSLLEAGTLVRILPEYSCEEKPTYLVYPSRDTLSRRTEIFIEALIERLRHIKGVRLAGQRTLAAAQ